MKNIIKSLAILCLFICVTAPAIADTYYWTSADKTLDGIYMNCRVLKTTTDVQPSATSVGKTTEVTFGPTKSFGDAQNQCNSMAKEAKKNGVMVKNLCSIAVAAR